MAKISARERRKLDIEIEKRKDKLRRKFPEIHGKLLDYVTHRWLLNDPQAKARLRNLIR